MTDYQRVWLKLGTTHPTSHNSLDCQTHVWFGPIGEHVARLYNHRAYATLSLIGADHNWVWQAMP